jgi:hypothetical protein
MASTVDETYMKAEKTACEKGDACGNMFVRLLVAIHTRQSSEKAIDSLASSFRKRGAC